MDFEREAADRPGGGFAATASREKASFYHFGCLCNARYNGQRASECGGDEVLCPGGLHGCVLSFVDVFKKLQGVG